MNQHHRGAPRVPPPRALPLRTVVIFGVFFAVGRYQSGCTTTTTRAAFLVVPQQKWMRHTSHNELSAVVSNQKKNLPNTGGNRPTNNNNKKKNDNNNNESPSLSRRQLVEASVGVLGLGGSFLASRENNEDDYGLWGILPVGPYKTKPTAPIETIVPHTLWTADQIFGILNVQVPLRMTIVKLKLPSRSHGTTDDDDTNLPKRMRIPSQQRYLHDNDYCLFIYNPIAPTRECIRMIQQIEQEEQCHVRHISVGSVALEHKVYAASMGQAFRYSTLWLTPGQYTFPLQIPEAPYLGFPTGGRTKMIPRTNPGLTTTNNNNHQATVVEWPGFWDTKELQSDILGPIISRDGAFAETVLYHRPTKTLIVTDTCLAVTDEVPAVYTQTGQVKPLLYHARDTVTDVVTNTPATLQKGWKRIALFALYFMPSAIVIQDVATAVQERRPDINPDFLGIYPWDWVGNEAASWEALTGQNRNHNINKEKPLVAPILQTLLLNRSPIEVLDFADRVATNWDIQRIVPSHFKNNLSLTGQDYRNAFQFLTVAGVPEGYPRPLASDLQLLRDAEVTLIQSGAIVTAPPKLNKNQHSNRAEILAQTTYRCRSNVCAPRSEP